MIDFNPLAEAIILLVSTAISVILIPWLRERYGNEKMEKIRGWVQIAVYAAEKLYGAGNGDQKLEYAEAFLAEHKIKLDTYELIALVNAEIKKMEQAEGTVIEYPLLEPVDDVEDTVENPVPE